MTAKRDYSFLKLWSLRCTPTRRGAGAGERVYYESLYRENPDSAMALIWCIEHGVFLAAEHESLLPRYEAAKSGKKLSGASAPAKTASAAGASVNSPAPKAAKA